MTASKASRKAFSSTVTQEHGVMPDLANGLSLYRNFPRLERVVQ
jgi:hypothetical protein